MRARSLLPLHVMAFAERRVAQAEAAPRVLNMSPRIGCRFGGFSSVSSVFVTFLVDFRVYLALLLLSW